MLILAAGTVAESTKGHDRGDKMKHKGDLNSVSLETSTTSLALATSSSSSDSTYFESSTYGSDSTSTTTTTTDVVISMTSTIVISTTMENVMSFVTDSIMMSYSSESYETYTTEVYLAPPYMDATSTSEEFMLNTFISNSMGDSVETMTSTIEIMTAPYEAMTTPYEIMTETTEIMTETTEIMMESTAIMTEPAAIMTETAEIMTESAETMTEYPQPYMTDSPVSVDFTLSVSNYPYTYASSPPSTTYNLQPIWSTTLPAMSIYYPPASTGFVTVGTGSMSLQIMSTSPAIFTGKAGRQGVDFFLVAAFPALVCLLIWV